MPAWRCSGVWSQNFATRTCASRPGPGRPRSIGRLGIGGCTIVSQARQLSFGRMWRITLKLEGTYSSTSRSSWPMRLNTVPPQPGQVPGCFVGDGLARQVWRQRLADRMLAFPPLDGLPGVSIAGSVARLDGTGVRFEFADQQLKLLDRVVELLGGAAEARAA